MRKQRKRLLSGKKNLERILILCLCVDAANKSCRWQAQSLQQYNTGRSRCKAVIIFRAPHTEGKMLLSLSGHASEMASASTLSVFMLSTRHAYKGTNTSQLEARVFGCLPQKPTYKTYFIFRGILKKRKRVKLLYATCRVNVTKIVLEMCVRFLVTESYAVAKYSGLA